MSDKSFVYLGGPEKKDELVEWISFFSRVLAVIGFAFGVTIFLKYYFNEEKSSQIKSISERRSPFSPVSNALPSEEGGSFSQYDQVFQLRNFFSVSDPETPSLTSGSGSPGPETRSGFHVSSFRLAGIILAKEPQVIVEDLRTRQISFVKPGEVLEGAVLQEIRKDRAIFSYQDQMLEMVR